MCKLAADKTPKEDNDYFIHNGVKFSKHPRPSLMRKQKHPLEDIDNGQLATWRAKF